MGCHGQAHTYVVIDAKREGAYMPLIVAYTMSVAFLDDFDMCYKARNVKKGNWESVAF